MKLTRHNGRAGKNGVYNPKHNDRSFDIANSVHIDEEAIFKNRHPVAMDRKLENSVIELKIELLKAKAENEKLAEQNQELKRKNELLQQELEKLNKRVSRKEISVLKKL